MPISDVRVTISSEADAKSSAAMAKADEAEKVAAAAVVQLGDATITIVGPIALSLAPRTVTIDVPLAQVGDRVYAHQRAGYTLGGIVVTGGVSLQTGAFVPITGKVDVTVIIPAIVLGASLVLPIKLLASRPAA